MAVKTHDHVSAVSLFGGSVLGNTVGATYRKSTRAVDSTNVGDIADSECITRHEATLDLELDSSTASCKVTNANLTAVTLDSVDIKAFVDTISFSHTNSFKDSMGLDDGWVSRQFVKSTTTASVMMRIPLDAATEDALVIDVHNSDYSNSNMVLSLTLNSVVVTAPFYVRTFTYRFARGDFQYWEFELGPRGAVTAPSGTTSLLEKLINQPDTSQALVLTSKAAGGLSYTGNFIPASGSFSINQDEIVITSYQYVNQGAIAVAATV